MAAKQSIETQLAVLQTDMNYLKSTLAGVDEKVSSHYVLKTEFTPVQKIVYGMVGVILIAVVGSLLNLVVKD